MSENGGGAAWLAGRPLLASALPLLLNQAPNYTGLPKGHEADAQRLQALSTDLDKAIVDRGVGSAAIDFASSIIDKVRDLADGLA